MPGDFRCDRGDYARVLFYFAHEAAGASCARHSLRPLISGRKAQTQLGRIAPRGRGVVFGVDVIARSNLSAVAQRAKAEATKQSTLTSRQHGLLRGACHRARIRATRWPAMTASKRAKHSAVIAREGGRSSIPETLMIESKGRGVLDTRQEPVIWLAEGQTRWTGITTFVRRASLFAEFTPSPPSRMRMPDFSRSRLRCI